MVTKSYYIVPVDLHRIICVRAAPLLLAVCFCSLLVVESGDNVSVPVVDHFPGIGGIGTVDVTCVK